MFMIFNSLRTCFLVLSVLFLASACSLSRSKQALSMEDLLVNAAEVVSFAISDTASVHTIGNWISDDIPNRASISCPSKSSSCSEVMAILQTRHIIVDEEDIDGTDKVTLSYDHVTTRECPLYAFGCSVSINALHMVHDHNQVLNPAPLSAHQNAAQAVDAYKRAHSDAL